MLKNKLAVNRAEGYAEVDETRSDELTKVIETFWNLLHDENLVNITSSLTKITLVVTCSCTPLIVADCDFPE